MREIEESGKQKLIDELESVIKRQDAFVSNVSHELRTPLNGIIGAAALLLRAAAARARTAPLYRFCSRKALTAMLARSAGISEGLLAGSCGQLADKMRRQVYIIRTSGARLLALINDVMDAAALRNHKLVLKQETVRLAPPPKKTKAAAQHTPTRCAALLRALATAHHRCRQLPLKHCGNAECARALLPPPKP